MKIFKIIAFFYFLILLSINLYSQKIIFKDSLEWENPVTKYVNKEISYTSLKFQGCFYPNGNRELPYCDIKYKLPVNYKNIEIKIINQVFEFVPVSELILTNLINFNLDNEIKFNSSIYSEKKTPYLLINFCPIVKNPSNGKFERLIKYEIEVLLSEEIKDKKTKSYATSSVLATGNWYKYAVSYSGIYKITKQDVVAMGLNPNNVDPSNISVFGNGGTPLPEKNSTYRTDDLAENAVYVNGGGDGQFNDNDYVLFYAKSPIEWKYNQINQIFEHTQNNYSNLAYYFITFDNTIGTKKRVQSIAPITEAANQIATKYSDFRVYENDKYNLLKSGKDWFGELFDNKTSYSFPFVFQNLDLSSPIIIGVKAAANSQNASSFFTNIGGSNQILSISSSASNAASQNSNIFYFTPSSSSFNVNITFNKPTSSAKGWLNYLAINGRCNLNQSSPQFSFRDPISVGIGNIAEYQILNGSSTTVWDVTDFNNAKKVTTLLSGSTLTFKSTADSLHEFIAFNGQLFYTPQYIEKVTNQNLHSLSAADMIIVSYPGFISEAQRLANYHNSNRGLSVHVVPTNQIYNEFGSGSPDPTAIRDFMKMFYDKYGPNSLKYLLLFGDASYDYKNILGFGGNYVPTYENNNSIQEQFSWGSDDYYTLLDDDEGENCGFGLLDISVGRFVVKSLSEANDMVDKTIRYLSNRDETTNISNPNIVSNFGDWRNTVTIIGDDADNNEISHLNGAISLSSVIEQNYKNYNVEKIYLDAYPQTSNSGGQRYPDVENAIAQRMRKGCLLMSYVGHGGGVGWAHERILRMDDISKWSNKYNMPIMLTLTCSFSHFDDPQVTTAGESAFLNNNGGAVALITSSRIAWSGTNETLGINILNNAFHKIGSKYLTLGDLISTGKNSSPSDWNNLRSFVLIGDPSIVLSYPKYKVETTHVNNQAVSVTPDTIKSQSFVTIKGQITDELGNKLNSYNGYLFPTVFDKPSKMQTLGNDPPAHIVQFEMLNNILFKGKVKVTSGDFEFSFIVPKDIGYNYGFGKISYYAKCDTADANGYFNNFIVGGVYDTLINDETPPELSLYMNDTKFISGGLTNENPMLLALVNDFTGINITGSGIGHDAVAILDDDYENSIILNDFYESDLNKYNSGKFKYSFENLSEGLHKLTVRVWDIMNNSIEKSIEFNVVNSSEFTIDNAINYPNPFSNYTNFIFNHNQDEGILGVKISIFNITGRLVKTIEQNTLTYGYRCEPIQWDGKDDYGSKITNGIYIFKISVTNSVGKIAEKTGKIVII